MNIDFLTKQINQETFILAHSISSIIALILGSISLMRIKGTRFHPLFLEKGWMKSRENLAEVQWYYRQSR